MTPNAFFQTLAVMSFWALCFPLITVGIEYAPHLTFAFLRAAIAGLTLFILALSAGQAIPNQRRTWGLLALTGLGSVSLGFLGMFHAAEFVSPGAATVVANTQPLLAAVLGGLILKERLTNLGKTGLATGFFGIVIIASSQLLAGVQDNYAIGVTYILLAAGGITLSNVLIKYLAGKVDALMAMGLQLLIGSGPLLALALFSEDVTSINWTASFISVLLILSLLGTALVYWLWISVLETTPLNQANAFSFLIPIFGLTLGLLFFGEELSWPQMFGISLTLAGIVLVTRFGTLAAAKSAKSDIK